MVELERFLIGNGKIDRLHRESVDARVIYFSSKLLGRPFGLGPTGDGFDAPFSLPIVSLESFDCLTFVETVIALSLAVSSRHFLELVKTLRYGKAAPSFAARNHFAGVDWIPSAIKHGLLEYSLPASEYSSTVITVRKSEWCDKLISNPMYRPTLTTEKISRRITQDCRKLAAVSRHDFGFLPFETINKSSQLSNGHILVILAPGSPQNLSAGGGDHVAHMGIVLENGGRWMFRGASQRRRQVVDVELDALLDRSRRTARGYGVGLFRVPSPNSSKYGLHNPPRSVP
jgi:hypothetical protein